MIPKWDFLSAFQDVVVSYRVGVSSPVFVFKISLTRLNTDLWKHFWAGLPHRLRGISILRQDRTFNILRCDRKIWWHKLAAIPKVPVYGNTSARGFWIIEKSDKKDQEGMWCGTRIRKLQPSDNGWGRVGSDEDINRASRGVGAQDGGLKQWNEILLICPHCFYDKHRLVNLCVVSVNFVQNARKGSVQYGSTSHKSAVPVSFGFCGFPRTLTRGSEDPRRKVSLGSHVWEGAAPRRCRNCLPPPRPWVSSSFVGYKIIKRVTFLNCCFFL